MGIANPIEYKRQINKLKASWQGLSQAFLSSDFLHGALDAVIGLVDGLTKLIDTFGAFPTLMGTVAAGFSAFKNKGLFTFDKQTQSIQLFGAQLSGLGDKYASVQSKIAQYNSLSVKSQEMLRAKWADSNTSFGKYISGLNGAKASFGGYIKSLVGAKAATIGLKIATTAMNAALTMGISVLVSWAIEGIMKLVNADKELAESVEEVTSKFKQEHDELKKLKNDYDTDNESSMISKYAKLSKGVDGLGKNVSLTAEEYSEYQSIINKIAEQIPSLVSGYDSQGNALLSCKGNVEELTTAYQKLIHLQNQEILSRNNGDIEKNWKNVLKQANGYDLFETLGNALSFDGFLGGTTDDYDMKTGTAEWLGGLTSDTSKEEIIKDIQSDTLRLREVVQALQDAGYDVNQWSTVGKISEVIKDILENEPEKIQNILDDHYAQFDGAVAEYKTKATALLSEVFDVDSAISGLNYGNISEELQSIAYQTVNSLDFDFLSKLSEQGKTIEQWTKEMLNSLNSLSETDNKKIETGFELQTKFNGGDISYGQYISQLQETVDFIDKDLKVPDEVKNQIKLSLNSEDVLADYNALVHDLKNIGFDDTSVNKFLNSLSAEEFSAAMKIMPDLDAGTTIDEIQKLIDEHLATEFKFDIAIQTEGIEALNTALAESRSATGLTAESITALKSRYEDLDSFNAAALFEKTANGVRLNADELSRLEEQYIATNKLEIDKNLSKLVEKYQDVNNELKTNTSLTADERKELEASKESLADKIDELSTLASQYDGLTSAFTNWQNALNGAEEGDNYDSVFENLEGMKELDDKGLVGTDKYKTFAQLMSYEDLSAASIDKVNKAFDKGYKKAARYFTEGKKGSKNFLKDLNAINSEWAHINKDGVWEVDINIDEVAKKLGISVEAVSLILDKLKDYGIKVEVDDTSLDNLQTDIEKAEAKVKELGQTPIPINLDTTDVKTIDSEIGKIKTRITEINNSSVNVETKTAQLEDARVKLEALIQKKQDASQPTFMNLNTSQVKASLVDALGYVQNYQNAINEVNKLTELKEAGISIDDSELQAAKEKAEEAAKAIQGLDGEVKVAIGLEENGSIDSIHKAFKDGKVVIDADTDPAVTKVELLAENVEKIEDKDITINVTVNGLDDVKELNKQIDLATDIDGDINKLSEYVESAKALSDLDSNITTYVTANIAGNVKDTHEFKLNNLETFAKGAKELKGVGTFSSKVTADIAGNVKDTPEFAINNLKVFSESAKGIEDIGDIKSKVTADIAGNVKDTPEYMINNLKAFTENAKDIDSIGEDVKAKITADIAGNVKDTPEFSINNLKVFTENAKDIENIGEDVKAKITADIEGNVKDTPEFAINNLKVFTDNAKDIEETGNVSSEVTANVKGNVVDTYEYQLDNLKKYTDSAKDIERTGDVESKVTANVEGNVVDTFEYQLDNLKVFTDNAKDVKNIGDVESSVTANIKGNVIDTFEYKIDNLKSYSDNAADVEKIGSVKSDVEANVSGNVIDEFEYKLDNLKVFSDSAKDVKDIGTVDSRVTANVDGNVTDEFEYKLNNLKVFSDSVKDIGNIGNVDSNVKANIEGNVIDEFEYKINNIEVFAEGAKTLKGIGNVESKVEANIDGNVIDEFEYKIDNLKVFSDNVKDIKGIGNVESKVTADVGGNVIDTKEYKIDNLKAYTDNAKDVESIGNVASKVTADVAGNVIDTKEYKIDNLKVYTDSAKKVESIGTVKSSVKADVSGNVIDTKEYKLDNLKVFGESAKKAKDIGTVTSNVTANVNGNVISTTEEKIDNLGVFADNANKLKNTGNFTSSVTASVGGNIITDDTAITDLEHFTSIVSGMISQTVNVSVTAKVDSENINAAIDLLKKVSDSGVFKDYSATVQVGAKIAKIDDTAVQNYKAPSKDSTVKYSVDPESSVYTWTAPSKDGVVNYDAKVDALTDAQKHKTGTITYKAKVTGFPVANGTANANGSAFANGTSGKAFKQGDWGVKKTTTALTGELGQELVVYGNRFWTVGDNGAEFATIPKGAIVFNHKQTAELFKNGKVTSDGGRGRVFANGTAYVEGTAFAPGKDGFYGNDDDDSSENKFEDTIDWIETILDRAERAIDKYEKQADNVYKTWDKRNQALETEITKVNEATRLYEQARRQYESEFNSIGLEQKYVDRIQLGLATGNDAIEDFSGDADEKTVEKIKKYEELYGKYLDTIDKIDELKEKEASLYSQRFDNVQSQYDGILQGYEHTESMLNEYINQAETRGQIVSRKYYDNLIANEKNRIVKLKQEQSELIKARDEAVASGNITKYSEEWFNMSNDIDAVTQEIEAANTATLEWKNNIRDIDWETFDLIQQRISDITDEADFLIELMSNKDLFDDNGKLTSQGLATMGLHGQNYNTYMYQSDDYAKEIAEIDKQLAKGYSKDLEERRRELIGLHRDMILAAEGEKDAIKDLVEEGINLELDALQEKIDLYNEALESQRDLYEYSKKVEEQTKNIANLQKQLSAYEGDNSEEAKAKIQELRVSLEEAEADLQETEYEKFISDQSALLDNLYTQYELKLNERIDNTDALIRQVIDGVNASALALGVDGTITTALGENGAIALALSSNATSIGQTLKTEATNVGTTLSNAMNNIWNTGEGNAKSVLEMYGNGFQSKQTTTNTELSSIKSGVNSLVSAANKDAEKKVAANKTTTSAQKNPTTSTNKTTTTQTNTNKSTSTTGDGKPKVGDKVTFVSGQYYYSSQGVSPLGSKYQGKQVYITKINNASWATHPYHISTGKTLGSGDLGWLKLNQLNGYAAGKKKIYGDEYAWTQEQGQEFIVRPSDGAILTPVAKGDSVLTSAATNNIWNMANNPAEFIKDNLNLGTTNVPNNLSVQNSVVQNFEKVVFSMPNVRNYDEMVRQMQRDPNFERLVESMSIGKLAGKSSLAKGKAIR